MGFIVLLKVLVILVLFFPNILGEPDNFILANPITTPAHIVPEWYFLFAYAILRSIPRKLGGVVGLFASILLLLLLPLCTRSQLKGNTFYPFNKLLHWIFVVSFLMLTLGGAWPVEKPYIITSRYFSFCYFSFFVLQLPFRRITDVTF